MAKNFEKEAQKLLDMSDVNQFQSDISDYSVDALVNLGKIFAKYKLENGNGEYDSELNDKIKIIKETRLYKQTTVKSISKVIAKMEKEVKEEVAAPQATPPKVQKSRNSSLNGISIKNSSDTPKNSGVNYNYQRGQGDFFGKSSTFKFIKDKSDNRQSNSSNNGQAGFDFGDKPKSTRKRSEKSNIIRVSVAHLEAKVLKQIKDIGLVSGNISRQSAKANAPKKTIKRTTKFEKDTLALKNRDAGIREKHIEAISEKTRTSKELVELTDKLEKNKERRKNRQNAKDLNLKADIANDKLQLSHDLQIKREEVKLNGKRQSDEVRIELRKLAYKNSRDIAKDKQEIQLQKSQLIRKQQLHRDLHSIHPALGFLYGMSQNKGGNSNNQSGDSGGLISSILGGLAGGAGAAGVGMMGKGGRAFGGMKAGAGLTVKEMSKHIGKNALRLGGSRLPIIGAGIAGISEGMDSGSVGKGLATFAGALTGSALLGATAGAIFGPVGAIVGAIIGQTLGMIAAKDIFNHLSKDHSNSPSGAGAIFDQNLANRNKNVKQVLNPNSPQSSNGVATGGAIGNLINFLSSEEAGDYNTIYGGGKANLTDKTLQEVTDFQNNPANFPKGADSYVVGKHQFTKDTLKEEISKSGLDVHTTKFTPEIQDKLYIQRLRGYRKLDSSSPDEAKLNLAKETASIPVLKDMKGYYRNVKRGESYYAGGKVFNKALHTPEAVEKAWSDYEKSKSTPMKAPSKIESLQNSTNRMQDKSMEEKSKPINMVNVGGSSGGSTNVVNNTYVNPANTDATLRQLANNMMYPGRLV